MSNERTRTVTEHEYKVICKCYEIVKSGNSAELKLKDGKLTVTDVNKKKVL